MTPRKALPVLSFVVILSAAGPLTAQLVLGQYENEAPFRTWNSYPFVTALSLGRGETALALPSDASAGLTNPALLARLPRWTITLNGFFQYATALRYAYINTGVLSSAAPIGRSLAGLDLAAVAFRFGDWAVSAAAADFEFYHRPAVHVEMSDNGQLYYSNDFDQTGTLRGYSFSLARRFGGRLSVGLTVISLQGELDRSSVENVAVPGYTITSTVSQKYSGLAFQGGILWEPWNGFTLAVTVRGPYTKKSDSRSMLRYQAPAGLTDIEIQGAAADSLRQPWIAGLGVAVRPLDSLSLSADAVFYGWSRYAPEFFGEIQDRRFRDIVRVGIGAEYETEFRLFGGKVVNPNRAGLVYDPQPMADPRSSYFYYTFGTGFHWKGFHLDVGASIGSESGSGQALTARRIALTMSFILGGQP